jgi:hypothetical protein
MTRPSRAQAKQKRKLTGAQFGKRFEAEKALQLRRYAAAFALWRACRIKRCRRDGSCRGKPADCLMRAIAAVPHQAQWQARQDVLLATPPNIGAPERAARALMPLELCTESGAVAAARYLAFR